MKRASLLAVVLCGGAALAACDIPAAVFDGGTTTTTKTTASGGSDTTSMGGTGGATTSTITHPGGGGAGGTGGDGGTTMTTTTTTTLTGPTVPCGWPNPVMECDPGQVCCFDKGAGGGGGAVADFCSAPGTCDPPTEYAELKCNENADCTSGKVCCAFYALDPDQQYRVQKTYCAPACDSGNQEIATCTDSSCDGTDICTELFGSAYPTYKFCLGI